MQIVVSDYCSYLAGVAFAVVFYCCNPTASRLCYEFRDALPHTLVVMCVYLSYCFLWTWTFWLFSSDLRHQKSIFIQRTVSHWIMDHSLLTLDMVVWEKPSRPSLSEIFAPAHLEQYPCHIQSHSYHSFFYSDTRCELQQVILMCLHPRWLTGVPNKVANECTYFAVNIVFQYSFFFV